MLYWWLLILPCLHSQSAKARAQTALRVAKHRNTKNVTDTVTSSVTRTEKIREENISINTVADDANLQTWAKNLARRPDWLPEGKPWIEVDTWCELAKIAPNATVQDFDRIMKSARQGRNTLANPAGFIITQIKKLGSKK